MGTIAGTRVLCTPYPARVTRGNQRGEGRAKVGGKGTRCPGNETERGKAKRKREEKMRGEMVKRHEKGIWEDQAEEGSPCGKLIT